MVFFTQLVKSYSAKWCLNVLIYLRGRDSILLIKANPTTCAERKKPFFLNEKKTLWTLLARLMVCFVALNG